MRYMYSFNVFLIIWHDLFKVTFLARNSAVVYKKLILIKLESPTLYYFEIDKMNQNCFLEHITLSAKYLQESRRVRNNWSTSNVFIQSCH